MREAQDILQWIFDAMANERLRFVIEGEMGDVDVSMEESRPTRGEYAQIANGHGENFEGAFDDLIERHEAASHAD